MEGVRKDVSAEYKWLHRLSPPPQHKNSIWFMNLKVEINKSIYLI